MIESRKSFESSSRPIVLVAVTPLTLFFFNRPLVSELVARGFRVEIWCNTNLNTNVVGEIRNLGATLRHFEMYRRPSLGSDIITLYQIWRACLSIKPTVIVSLVPKAGLLSSLAGFAGGIRHRVHIFQGEVWYGKTGLYRRFFRMVDRLTASLSTHCLCVSNSEREFLVKNHVVGDAKLFILGAGSICGVNIPQILRQEKKPDASVALLFVGRVARDKGIFDLLGAFQELLERGRAVTLTIVGPLELPEELASRFKAICAGLGERVVVRSFETDLDKYYRACDILCLPSHREGFGMVAIEASSYAKPVVGYDIVGLRDAVIHGETGLLCSPKNIDGLCDALEQLVIQPTLRESLGKAGRSYVEANFRRDQVVTRYADYISSLVDCKP